jgi:hypothetical protein
VASKLNEESNIVHHRHSTQYIYSKISSVKPCLIWNQKLKVESKVAFDFYYNWVGFSCAIQDPRPYFDHTIVQLGWQFVLIIKKKKKN